MRKGDHSTTRGVADEALLRAGSNTGGGGGGGGGSTTSFVLSGSSSPLSIGDVFCLAPGQASGTLVTKAFPAELAQAGIVAGVASTNVSPGAQFDAPVRVVPSAVTGIGPQPNGKTQNVTVNSFGRLERIFVNSGGSSYKAPFTAGGYVIAGVADPHGNVTLVSNDVVTTSAREGLSLATFGAKGTGDDILPFFDAAMAAVSQAPHGTFSPPWDYLSGKVDVFIPPGNYVSSGPLFLYRSVYLHGIPAGRWAQGFELDGSPSTSIVFPKGVAGIIVPTESDSFPGNPGGAGTQGQNSVIEHLDFFGGYQGGTLPPQWFPGTSYAQGDIVRFTFPNPHGYVYRARNAGTSGGTQPRPSDDWPVPPPTYSVGDNGITWDLVQAHGLWMGLAVYARNCRFIGFAGHGVQIASDTATGYLPDVWYLDHCSAFDCGGSGLNVEGGDSNAGLSNILFTRNNGEFGIRDVAGLGNCHTMPHSANSTGAGGYYTTQGKFVEPYSESGDGAYLLDEKGGVTLGGEYGDGLMANDFKPPWPGSAQAVVSGTIIRELPGVVWTNGTAKASGAAVNPTGNAGTWFSQINTSGGVTGGVEPTWPDTIGATVNDGSCTWMCMGGPVFYYATNDGVTGGAKPNFALDRHGRTISRNGQANPGDPRNIVDNQVEWAMYSFGLQGLGLLMGATAGLASPRNFEVLNRQGPIDLRAGLGSQNNREVVRYLLASDDSNAPVLELYDQSFDPHHWAVQIGTSPSQRVESASVTGATEGVAQKFFHSKSIHWTNGSRIDVHWFRITSSTSGGTSANLPICDLYLVPSDGFSTQPGTVISATVEVFGRSSTTSDFARFEIVGTWRNDGGVLSPTTGTPIVEAGEPTDGNNCSPGATTWLATFTTSGAAIFVTVTGQEGVDINWSGTVTFKVSR